jgi:hypothetical protein
LKIIVSSVIAQDGLTTLLTKSLGSRKAEKKNTTHIDKQ